MYHDYNNKKETRRESMRKNDIILPFLKWAGGKRWFVSAHPDFLSHPFNRYIEPFLGSGAVFFHLEPKKSILADRNEDLIETYQAIKDDWKNVEHELKKHHNNHSKNYYYSLRDSKPRNPYTRAARFIYLNRTCWNGLYRVNLKGKFNVPIGTKQRVILDTDNFEAVSRLLRNSDLMSDDFENVIELAGKNDFVFVDPPYTIKHNLNGFIKYNEKLFSWDDQKRLRDAVVRASARGAAIIISNANHHSVRELYKGIGTHKVLTRSSILAADSSNRGKYQELVIKC